MTERIRIRCSECDWIGTRRALAFTVPKRTCPRCYLRGKKGVPVVEHVEKKRGGER